MTRFTLAIAPDGRAVLTTEARLSGGEAQQVQDAVNGWLDGRWPVLVIPECRTVQVAALELDLGAVRGPSLAEIRHERLLEGVG